MDNIMLLGFLHIQITVRKLSDIKKETEYQKQK